MNAMRAKNIYVYKKNPSHIDNIVSIYVAAFFCVCKGEKIDGKKSREKSQTFIQFILHK